MSVTVEQEQSLASSTAPAEQAPVTEKTDLKQTQSTSQNDSQSQQQQQNQTQTQHHQQPHQQSHHIPSRKTPAELEAQKEIDSRSIYIGNVDYESTPDEIESFFSKVGPVNRVTILLDKYTGYPKGYAYVEFENGSDSLKAIEELNSSTFKERVITVVAKRTNLPGFKSSRGRGGSYRGRGGQRGGYRGSHYRGNGYRGGYRGGRGGYNNYHNNNNQSHQDNNTNFGSNGNNSNANTNNEKSAENES